MKKSRRLFITIFLFLFPLTSFAFTVPAKPTGFVQDYARLLTPEQVRILENKLEQFEKETTDEIAVVTIYSLDGDTIENVAQEIFTKWGIGKKGKDNGVLLLVSFSDRKTRIHTGYGVENKLTDIGTSYIQSEVIAPAFRRSDYYGGINDAVDKMTQALGGADIAPPQYEATVDKGMRWGYWIFGLFIVFQWITAVLGRSKSWWAGGVFGAVFGGIGVYLGEFSLVSVIAFILLVLFGLGFDYFVSKRYDEAIKDGGHPPWWLGGGFGGGSGRGGGFGGFGGGSSGGGGSSSSW